jgi:hypothetical protein
MGRSILAIVVGFLLIGALAFGADAVVRSAVPGAFDVAGRTDSVPLLLLSLAYVGIFATAGCYLTARLAPNRPMRHALILGLLGLILNVVGSVQMWDSAPAWYHVVAIAMVMPYAWLGGWLRERQLARAGAHETAVVA